jgi:uncharacterized protein (DUF983 family)
MNLKGCPRCNGDMMPEDFLGDVELVCLQCGHRVAEAPAQRQAYTVRPVRKAA